MKPTQPLVQLFTSLLVAGAAAAQTAPAPKPAAENDPVTLSAFEVRSEKDYGYLSTNSVTATRASRPIFETPLAISVLNEDFLNDIAGTGNLLDATRYTASVSGETRNDGASRGVFGVGNGTIRGFPVDAILRNGISRRGGFSFDNVARLEILKGPVSVFFGSAQPGGTINYVMKQPEFATKGRVSLMFTEYPSEWASDSNNTTGYQAQIAWNDHFKKKLAYSLYASTQDRGGWHDSEYFKAEKFTPSVLWQPNNKVKLLLEYEHLNYKANPAGSAAIGNPHQMEDYANPPARVLAANNLTAAQYRTQILGSQANWRTFWINTVGDSGPANRTYNLFFNTGLGVNGIGRSLPTTKPSFSFQGPGHFQNSRNESWSTELTLTPLSWATVRAVTSQSRNYFEYVATFRGAPNADYTWNLATGNGGKNLSKDRNGQLDVLLKAKTWVVAHTLVLGGDIFDNDSSNNNGATFNYNTAPAVVTASGQQISGLAAISNWDPLLHGGIPDSTRYFTGWGNVGVSNTKSFGRYLSWNGEFRVAERRIILSLGERREQYVSNATFANRGDSKGPSSTKGIVVEVTDWLNVYASKSSNYRPNAPGFAGGGLSATGVGVNRDINGRLVTGLNEAALLPDQTGTSKEVGLKVETKDRKWSAAVGWFEVRRANVRVQDIEKGFRDPRNVVGSFYPGSFLADGSPNPSSLRQVNAGFSPITFFTASGLQRNQGLEVEGFWTPMPNYQVALSFTNIYRSKTLANNSLAGATAYEILNTDRRLGYSPEYAIGLFNKYTFNRGALKGLSLAGGVNGQTSTNPRYEIAFDKPDFNPSYLVADITLGYATTVFRRRVNLTLNCNNVFDRLYEKGQFGYGEPRKITFRTDFNF